MKTSKMIVLATLARVLRLVIFIGNTLIAYLFALGFMIPIFNVFLLRQTVKPYIYYHELTDKEKKRIEKRF